MIVVVFRGPGKSLPEDFTYRKHPLTGNLIVEPGYQCIQWVLSRNLYNTYKLVK